MLTTWDVNWPKGAPIWFPSRLIPNPPTATTYHFGILNVPHIFHLSKVHVTSSELDTWDLLSFLVSLLRSRDFWFCNEVSLSGRRHSNEVPEAGQIWWWILADRIPAHCRYLLSRSPLSQLSRDQKENGVFFSFYHLQTFHWHPVMWCGPWGTRDPI